MPVSDRVLADLLLEVEKPVRYIGSEWNSIVRAGADVDVRVALAYPDQYEIGMSHLGFRILYSLLNRKQGVAAERVFAPWPDMEAALRKHRVPLTTLETRTPLGELDLIGFSLQYEMTLTNVLLMLDLAGIPLMAADRREGDPLIVAGGPVALAPEPFADFFDLIAMGDGEEMFPELIDRMRELRDGGADRATIVGELGRLPGMYAPAFYELAPDPATGLMCVTGSQTHPYPVRRRILMDLSRHPFPQDIIVPYCEVVHSRVAVEIMRGCNVGCRFCQAGYIYRPERPRSADDIVRTAIGSSERTGFDDVSLTSLNTGEYPQIENVLSQLMDRFEPSTTALSLPSLRASSLTSGLLDEIQRVRKSGLTIAPEGGTQRMRDVINKNISEADIQNAAEAAYGHGWQLIKLYFMIGQPTERDEDVDGIARTALDVLSIGRKHQRHRARVNLGVSSFIPKAFTPFQWLPMDRPEELARKHERIRERLGRAPVKFGRHDVDQSLVEAAISRGDRRLARVILRAYRAGARFDGWKEHFNMRRWQDAFAAEGLDFDAHAHRSIPTTAGLPWDHVDIGVRKSFLADELARALEAKVVTVCSGSDCHGCGTGFIKECLTGNVSPGREFPKRRERTPEPGEVRAATSVYRIAHEKTGWVRFISHLDLQRTMRYWFRRAGIEVAHTEGFHPLPRIAMGPPLPLGFESVGELADVHLLREIDPALLVERLAAAAPSGLRVTAALPAGGVLPKLSAVNAAEYLVEVEEFEMGTLAERVGAVLSSEHISYVKVRKQGASSKAINLRAGILALSAEGVALRMTIRLVGGHHARPDEIASAVLGRHVPRTRVRRTRLWIEREGVLANPLATTVTAAAPVGAA